MRKTAAALGLVLTLLAAVAPAFGQSSIVSQIAGDKAATDALHFGIKFGFSCSRLRGLGSGDRLGGFFVGLAASVRLSPRVSLGPEVTLFARKGATEIPFVTTGDPGLDPYFAEATKSAMVLDYLEIPVPVLYRLGRFEFGAGPFAGFLSQASRRYRAEISIGEELLHVQDIAASCAKVNYGFVLEATWTITKPRRGEGLVFHVRYQGGLSDIDKTPDAPGPVRTSGLQIALSFPFIR